MSETMLLLRRGVRRVRPAFHRTVPLLLSVALSQLALVGSGVVTARVLGVADRGVYTGVTLLPTLVSLLTSLSAGATSNVLVSQGERPLSVFLKAAKVVGSAGILAGVAVAVVTGQLWGQDVMDSIEVGVGVLALSLVPLPVGLFAGLRKYWIMLFCSVTPLVCYSSATLVGGLLLHRSDVNFYVFAWGVGLASGVTLTLFVTWVVLGASDDGGSGKETTPSGEIARRGLRSIVASQSPLEAFRGDQVVVLLALGTSSLGLYSVALSAANVTKMLGEAFGWTTPHLVNDRRALATRRLDVSSGALALVALLIVAIIPFALPFVFGRDYAQAVPTAAILCIAGAFQGSRKLYTEALRTLGAEKRASIAELVGIAVFVVVTGLLLLCQAGLLAVAIGLGASAVGSVLVMRRNFRKLLGLGR